MCSVQHDQHLPPVVAVVDDDGAVRNSLANLLRSAGYIALAFDSAEAFLAFEGYADFSCVVLDVRLTGKSGIELQRQLKDDGIDMPTVFISAEDDDAVQLRAFDAGARAFLHKPIDAELLLRNVREVSMPRSTL